MTVLLIALAHAIPIIVTRLVSDSKRSLGIAAAVMAIIAIAIGNPTYLVSDLFAVGLAYYLCYNSISRVTSNGNVETVPPVSVAPPDEKNPDVFERATEAIPVLLQVQLTLSSANADDVAADHWALGYVFGFHDGILQGLDVNDQTETLAIAALSYEKIFGSADIGSKLLRKSLDLQHDETFKEGVRAGGEEGFAFAQEKKSPMGLASHMREKESREQAPEELLYCAQCGTELASDANFCFKCGAASSGRYTPESETDVDETTREPESVSGVVPAALGTKWLKFWTYVSLPVGGILGLLMSIGLPVLGVIIMMPLAILQFAVAYGLHNRKLWAWRWNRVLIVITFLSILIPVPTPGSGNDAAAMFIQFAIKFALGWFIWMWPNRVYWEKRKHLFT